MPGKERAAALSLQPLESGRLTDERTQRFCPKINAGLANPNLDTPLMITRRQALELTSILAVSSFCSLARARASEPLLSEDGLHIQPWFSHTFLDLKDDLAEATSSGRHLVIFWEQRGCPYCRELHHVNLVDDEIVAYIQANFLALQLNLFGSREVTDFDGAKMEERQLAARWRINFTPTLCFFPATVADAQGKSGRDAEVWRLLGYWKPFHFQSTFVYVKEEGYKSQPNFQRWLADYADRLRAEGKEVKLW
jgi:thioredoxin-related protein